MEIIMTNWMMQMKMENNSKTLNTPKYEHKVHEDFFLFRVAYHFWMLINAKVAKVNWTFSASKFRPSNDLATWAFRRAEPLFR